MDKNYVREIKLPITNGEVFGGDSVEDLAPINNESVNYIQDDSFENKFEVELEDSKHSSLSPFKVNPIYTSNELRLDSSHTEFISTLKANTDELKDKVKEINVEDRMKEAMEFFNITAVYLFYLICQNHIRQESKEYTNKISKLRDKYAEAKDKLKTTKANAYKADSLLFYIYQAFIGESDTSMMSLITQAKTHISSMQDVRFEKAKKSRNKLVCDDKLFSPN